MTDERTRLLAEKARIEAELIRLQDELAELDAEPDRELMADAVRAFRYASGCEAMTFDEVYDGLIAAAPHFPRDAGMTDAEIEALANECGNRWYLQSPSTIAEKAIRETLKRAPQVRWPGEALAAMEQAREALGLVRPSTKVAEAKRVRSIATLTEQIERMRNGQG